MTEPRADLPERLLFFDGVCNLCTGSVRFVIRHDRRARIQFASFQGATGSEFLRTMGLPTEAFASLIYLRNGRTHMRSDAALYVARDLGGGWSLAYGLIIVPRVLRDAVYDLIARKRYAWFGRKDSCMVPTPELMARFEE